MHSARGTTTCSLELCKAPNSCLLLIIKSFVVKKKFFRRMLNEKVGFDCVTLVSVLSACARSGALETGKWVHEFARNHGLDSDARIGKCKECL